MEPKKLELLIVIVCYRVPELTVGCLESIASQIHDEPGVGVAVCENGTGPESVRMIREAIARGGWDEWVWFQEIAPNRGFAGGTNYVLEQALQWSPPPRHYMILNADTVLRPGALREMADAARAHPQAGIIAPRLEDEDGTPQISCFRYIGPISEFIRAAGTGPITKLLQRWDVPMPVSDVPIEPEWAGLACGWIRGEVVQQIGILDPGYFLYFDDVDYCRRARQAGWTVLYWPRARVLHYQGRSSPVEAAAAARKRRPRYFYASRSRYLAKMYGRTGLWWANVLWTLGRGIAYTRETLGSKQRNACDGELGDNWTHWRDPMVTPHLPYLRNPD